jgi:hypothetical protein
MLKIMQFPLSAISSQYFRPTKHRPQSQPSQNTKYFVHKPQRRVLEGFSKDPTANCNK